MFRVWGYCARRDGRPIPRWQLHAVKWVQGSLSLREERDDWLGRTIKVAHLRNDERAVDLFLPLIEAQVLLIDAERIVLSGVERDDLSRCDLAQTWVLHLTETAPRSGTPGEPMASRVERP